MRSRSPLDALSLVLGSVDAVRNVRALYVLLTTFALAGLLTAMAQGSLVRGAATPGALQAAAALFVAFYGGSAAGILTMDDARGVPVREIGDALRAALSSAHRLIVALAAIAIGYAALGALLVALLWLARADVAGETLGSWLFGALVPVAVVAVGLAMLAGVAVVVPLAAPGVWAGARAGALVRQLWRWTRFHLLKVALLMAAVSLLTAGVGVLASFVVVSGGRVVAQLATQVAGIDVPPALLMAGLFGRGAGPALQSPHAAAALVGEGVVFALALVLPGLVYLRGTCSVYLAMCEDSPDV
ncbi:MAG TPA: hypothetical protein VFZ93_01130 [Albitalea sp.]